MNSRNGFVSVGILLAIILSLVVVGGGAYYVMQQQSPSQTASENGLDDLQALPTTQQNTNTTQTTSPSPTANWKTYRSEVWGIEFKYPSNFVLNTSSDAFWKNFDPYRNGNNFFELIDRPRGCYIGPVRVVGLGYESSKRSSIKTSDGTVIEVLYWTADNGSVVFGLINDQELPLNLTSLSGDLVVSSYKNAAASRYISDGCIKDFEAILATIKFTKSAPSQNPTTKAEVKPNSAAGLFSILPISGVAPLTVSFNFHGRVYGQAKYRVYYGEGELVELGNTDCTIGYTEGGCIREWSSSHTYNSAGTYKVILGEKRKGTCPGSDPAAECEFPEALDAIEVTVK